MGKRLSQLNSIEPPFLGSEDYLLVDGDDYLESKKIKLADINLNKFDTTDFYDKLQTDESFVKKEANKGLSSNDYTTEDKQKLDNSQDLLVSGRNIKTINGESILGEGNIQIEGNEGSIRPKIELWQPNTFYRVGDIVLGKWLGSGFYYMKNVIAECRIEHWSSDSMYLNDQNEKCWTNIQQLTAAEAISAEKDIMGNSIISTYATKEALNNIISAGLKREIIEDFFPRFDDSDSNTIYMKKRDSSRIGNYYNEYLMVGLKSFDVITNIHSVMVKGIDVSDTEIDFVGVSINKLETSADGLDVTFSSVNYRNHKISIDEVGNSELIHSIINGGADQMSFDFHYKDHTLTNVRIYSIELIGSTEMDLKDYAKKDELSNKMDKFGSYNGGVLTLGTDDSVFTYSIQPYYERDSSIECSRIYFDIATAGITLEADVVRFGRNSNPVQVSGVGTPVYDEDAANKIYVDTQIGDIETALDNIITKYGLGGETV